MINAIDVYRLGRWCLERRIPLLPMATYYIGFMVFNSSIPPAARIGAGTRCAYGGIGVVIHGAARIGKGVVIGQGVTVGGRSRMTGAPDIHDNVYLGAGCRVLGPVVVGEGSLVAPNAVVIEDVPPRTIVGGIPARVIRRDVDIREFV